MKFVCIGYLDEDKWGGMSKDEQTTLMAECTSFGEELQTRGHYLGAQGLLHSRQTTTLRSRQGKLLITDGPFAETKEQIGGIFFIDAVDMQHAVELMSTHPGLLRLGGPFEIRPADDSCDGIEAPDLLQTTAESIKE